MSNGHSVPPVPGPRSNRYDLDRTVRLVIAIAVCVGLFYLVRFLADVLLPLAIAVLIAYLLNPLVCRVDKRIRNRTFSVCLILAGLGAGLMAVAMVAIPIMAHEWKGVSNVVRSILPKPPPPQAAPQTTEDGEAQDAASGAEAPKDVSAPSLPDRWKRLKEKLDPDVREWVLKGEDSLSQVDWNSVAASVTSRITPTLLGAISGVFSLAMWVTAVFLVLVYLIFLLFDFPAYSDHWQDFIPPDYRPTVVEFAREFASAMSKYFRGQFLIATCTGILYAAGFWLVGLRLALPLGVLLGVMNMVPYLQLAGVPIALLLAVVSGIESSANPTPSTILWALVWVALVFLVVQLIQDWILTPRIMGQSTGLRPVIMMVGLFVWGKLLGFLGVVLAIPLTCMGIACYRKLVLGHRLAPAAPPDSAPTG